MNIFPKEIEKTKKKYEEMGFSVELLENHIVISGVTMDKKASLAVRKHRVEESITKEQILKEFFKNYHA